MGTKKCTELNLKTPLLSLEQIKLINQLTRILRDQKEMIKESVLVHEQISQFLEEEGICSTFHVQLIKWYLKFKESIKL